LFHVVDAAYERRSIALTSNIGPAGFGELMPKTLAARRRARRADGVAHCRDPARRSAASG